MVLEQVEDNKELDDLIAEMEKIETENAKKFGRYINILWSGTRENQCLGFPTK